MAELELPALVLDSVQLARPLGPWLLVNRAPEPGGTGVLRRTPVMLELVGPVEPPWTLAQVQIWVQGRRAYDGAHSAPFSPAFSGPRSGVEPVPGGYRLTLDPIVPFSSEERVRVRVVVLGGGQGVWEEAYGFDIEDATPPRLIGARAVCATRIVLGFDEPVMADALQASFQALDVPAVPLQVVGERTVAGPDTEIELDLATPMTPDVRYRVSVHGVVDRHGNSLRLSDGVGAFRGFRPPRPPTRRFDLWSMLPRYNRREDITCDLRKLIACFQEVVDLLLAEIDRFSAIMDVERAPEEFVDLMLAEVGNPFPFVLNDVDKRRLAAVLVELYRLKGTERGIRNAVRYFLGLELGAITTYSGSPLILGESLLGVDWELGPSSRFALYAFEVRVPITLSVEQRQRLRALILWSKPAHTHLVGILEPTVIVELDEWILGESVLAVSTILV